MSPASRSGEQRPRREDGEAGGGGGGHESLRGGGALEPAGRRGSLASPRSLSTGRRSGDFGPTPVTVATDPSPSRDSQPGLEVERVLKKKRSFKFH